MFTKEEQYSLIQRASSGDEKAREELVKNNMGLVKNVAYRFKGFGYEWEDLVQIGCIGLIKAIERFNTSFDVMFSTYAMPLILGEIKRYIRDDGRIKISREVKNGIIKLRTVREKLLKEKGDSPKLSEIAEAMETDVEAVLNLIEAEQSMYSMSSLDDPESFEKESSNRYENDSEEHRLDLIMLKGIIENLPYRERQIIILRYYKDMTQSEIAKLMGISQVHVSRLEKKTLMSIGASFGQDTGKEYQE